MSTVGPQKLKLKWDKKRKERLCKNCHYAHSKTDKHCVNCCKIFDKVEVEELLSDHSGRNQLENELIPCKRCKMPTNIGAAAEN